MFKRLVKFLMYVIKKQLNGMKVPEIAPVKKNIHPQLLLAIKELRGGPLLSSNSQLLYLVTENSLCNYNHIEVNH
jgi:hypothetical protein